MNIQLFSSKDLYDFWRKPVSILLPAIMNEVKYKPTYSIKAAVPSGCFQIKFENKLTVLAIERRAIVLLQASADFTRLQTVPGIGPIIALTILAEAGDLRRFQHYRQFLKFCGFNLCTQRSGTMCGQTQLSKRGNARLRQSLWMAAQIAVQQHENSFRKKFKAYCQQQGEDPDSKRKAYTAVAVKMARVIHSMVKQQTDYRGYYESP